MRRPCPHPPEMASFKKNRLRKSRALQAPAPWRAYAITKSVAQHTCYWPAGIVVLLGIVLCNVLSAGYFPRSETLSF